jgi:RNA 3'-terminal phosphate cyclase (ATP)
MLTVDGSRGEGGGQILRTSLALSLVSGTPFRIERIRAGRAKPGLMRQHLTALEAAAVVGDADVEGAGIGAQEIVFRPKRVRSGSYGSPSAPRAARGSCCRRSCSPCSRCRAPPA